MLSKILCNLTENISAFLPNKLCAVLPIDGAYGGYVDNDVKFSCSSDISTLSTAYYENQSVVSALLGSDNAFVNRWGGCLYRDNFYFSINKDMEYRRETGVIRYKSNMIEIEFSVDYSECITYLVAVDNFGNRKTVKNSAVPSKQFPHHKYKFVKFRYDVEDVEQFGADAQAYYENYANGAVNIKVKFANIYGNELYEDYLQLADYEVGDRVIVYHADLDINYGNLEIIAKTYDVVNETAVDIEIGTFKNAISRTEYMSNTASTGGQSAEDKQMAAMQAEIKSANLKLLRNWKGAESFTWGEIRKYTWKEVSKNG